MMENPLQQYHRYGTTTTPTETTVIFCPELPESLYWAFEKAIEAHPGRISLDEAATEAIALWVRGNGGNKTIAHHACLASRNLKITGH